MFIYVIGSSVDGPVKIGISANPEKRLKQLQTGHSERLALYHIADVPDDRARLYERLLHRDIGYTRSHGEWFKLTAEQAIAQVEFTFIHYDLVENLEEKFRLRRI